MVDLVDLHFFVATIGCLLLPSPLLLLLDLYTENHILKAKNAGRRLLISSSSSRDVYLTQAHEVKGFV